MIGRSQLITDCTRSFTEAGDWGGVAGGDAAIGAPYGLSIGAGGRGDQMAAKWETRGRLGDGAPKVDSARASSDVCLIRRCAADLHGDGVINDLPGADVGAVGT